jgi:hypothetical protein
MTEVAVVEFCDDTSQVRELQVYGISATTCLWLT